MMVRFVPVPILVLGAFLSASCDLMKPSADGGAKSGVTPAGAKAGGARPPAPRPAPVVLPEGTAVPVVLETSLSSASNSSGDTVVARVSEDVVVSGRVVVPAQSEVRGRVTAAVRSGKV